MASAVMRMTTAPIWLSQSQGTRSLAIFAASTPSSPAGSAQSLTARVIAAGDLLLNKKKAAMAKIMEAYSNSRGAVHGNQAAYSRMTLGASRTFSPTKARHR
jgi:hypothetical protein